MFPWELSKIAFMAVLMPFCPPLLQQNYTFVSYLQSSWVLIHFFVAICALFSNHRNLLCAQGKHCNICFKRAFYSQQEELRYRRVFKKDLCPWYQIGIAWICIKRDQEAASATATQELCCQLAIDDKTRTRFSLPSSFPYFLGCFLRFSRGWWGS